MSGHQHHGEISRLSAHLEELFSMISECGGLRPLPPELADEIAATAGEIMVELADHRCAELARGVIEDARRLREIVRTIRPGADAVTEAGRTLFNDLEVIIREDKRAA
jgi:hypothetical protein